MINESQIQKIKEEISTQISLDDELERTNESNYLQNNFNDIKYLDTFHEILTMETPDVELHIFSFKKIANILMENSENFVFNEYKEKNGWMLEYIDHHHNFLIESPRLLFNTFVDCYLSLVKSSSSKYPYFQEFWNSLLVFVENVYANDSNLTYTVFFILRELLKMKEEESEQRKLDEIEKGKKENQRNDLQLIKNRQTVFNLSLSIMESTLQSLLSSKELDPSIDLLATSDAALCELSFDAVCEMSELTSSSNFRLFFAYSNFFLGNEMSLDLCEASLSDETNKLDGNLQDSALAIEEVVLEEERVKKKNRFSLIIDSKVNFLYFTKFIEILRNKRESFSINFVAKLEAVTAELINANFLYDRKESMFNLIQFFASYRSSFYEKPSMQLQGVVIENILKKIFTDMSSFVDQFGIEKAEEEKLASLLTSLVCCSFSEHIPEMLRLINECLMMKDDSEKAKSAAVAFSFIIRLFEHFVGSQIKSEKVEFVEDLVLFVLNLQNELLLPFLGRLAEGEEKQAVSFDDSEILSFFLFDKLFASADEVFTQTCMGYDRYIDALGQLARISHAALKCFRLDTRIAEVAIGVITDICETKSRDIYIDNDWMIQEENQIGFDVSTIEEFALCSSFYEALLTREMTQPVVRVGIFFTMPLALLDAATEEIGKAAKRDEAIKSFSLFLSIVAGLLRAFQKLCNRSKQGPVLNNEEEEESIEIDSKSVECGRSIIEYLYPDRLDSIIEFAESFSFPRSLPFNFIHSSFFLLFSIGLSSLIRRQIFDTQSSAPNEIFRRMSSVVCKIIKRAKARIVSLNREENRKTVETEEEAARFADSRNKCVTVLCLSVRFAAEILASNCVTFGAFLLYEDKSYIDFIEEVIDIFEYAGFDFIFDSYEGEDSEFDFKQNLKKLIEVIYANHLEILSQQPEKEKFDLFLASSLLYIDRFDECEKLLEIIVHELAKIAVLNGGICEQSIYLTEYLNKLVGDLFDSVFVEKNEDHGNPRLFAEYSCLSEDFALNLADHIMPYCQIRKKISVTKIIDNIVQASLKHEMKKTESLFVDLHSIWFKP